MITQINLLSNTETGPKISPLAEAKDKAEKNFRRNFSNNLRTKKNTSRCIVGSLAFQIFFLLMPDFVFSQTSISPRQTKESSSQNTLDSSESKSGTESASSPSTSNANTQTLPSTYSNNQNFKDQALDSFNTRLKELQMMGLESKAHRENSKFLVLGSFAWIDPIIPGKIGFTAGYLPNSNTSFELDYLRGSVALPGFLSYLGSITDQRVSLLSRSYFGSNSFNISYGLSYMDLSMTLGDELIGRVPGVSLASISLIKIQTLGVNIGIGNRWVVWKSLTLGCDWIYLNQPLALLKREDTFLNYATNTNDRDTVETGLKVLTYFPRLGLLRVQLGATF